MKIGIPRALFYYKYFPLFSEFLKGLGCEIITSPETNKKILDDGLKLAVDESCLSLKIFLGHVNEIKDKVDYLFVPRMEKVVKKEAVCTKFNALPDITRNAFDNIKLIEPNIEKANFFLPLFKEARKITKNPIKIIKAYRKAKQKQEEIEKEFTNASSYSEVLNLINNNSKTNKKPEEKEINIALLGHTYNVYDKFLGDNVVKKLEKLDVGITTLEMIPFKQAHRAASLVTKDMYWTYNKELIGATKIYIDKKIDGIILVTSFPCGPDALSTEIIVRTFKNKVPIINLIFDELEGDAGLDTRLESFVDMITLKRRKK